MNDSRGSNSHARTHACSSVPFEVLYIIGRKSSTLGFLNECEARVMHDMYYLAVLIRM